MNGSSISASAQSVGLDGDGAVGPTPTSFATFSWRSFWNGGMSLGGVGILTWWALNSRERVNPERFWFLTIAGTLLGVFASLVTTGVRHIWIRSRKEPRADRAHG
ncbi:MAG: hypothetical protein NTX54_05340 [Chloroflexi bacterium]|nr:hypothetical protein [Chloroflexota bacterium]